MPGEAQIAAQATGTLLGAVQSIGGLIAAGKANKNLKRLFSQRKAFQTPSEIFDILNMAESNASTGYSPQTLEYLTSGANAGLSSSLGTAQLLGADPNMLSNLLSTYSRDIFKIGGENELMKLKKLDGVTNALKLVADNKDAEWASRDNLIKDQMAAEAQKLQAANQNIQSGTNLALNSITSAATSGLYNKNSPSGGNAASALSVSGGTNSGLQGLSPSQLIKLKQLQELGLLD